MKLSNVGLTGSWISSEKDISRSMKYLQCIRSICYWISFGMKYNCWPKLPKKILQTKSLVSFSLHGFANSKSWIQNSQIFMIPEIRKMTNIYYFNITVNFVKVQRYSYFRKVYTNVQKRFWFWALKLETPQPYQHLLIILLSYVLRLR